MHADASCELGPKGSQLKVPGECPGKGLDYLGVV